MRVLILRGDNIGDAVLFSGALKHIRRLYPEARLTLALQEHILPLYELCPFVDDLVGIDRLTWWSRVRGMNLPFRRGLKKIIVAANRFWNGMAPKFDLVICPVKSPDVGQLEIVYCLNPSKSLGIAGCDLNAPAGGFPAGLAPASLYDRSLEVSSQDPWRHELHTTLDFLSFLGSDVAGVKEVAPLLWLSGDERDHLEPLRHEESTVVGIFPGATFAGRRWGTEQYGAVSRLLGAGMAYAVFGSAGDRELAERIATAIRENSPGCAVLDLTGRTTLRELAAALGRCDLVLSADSSGLHLALAADVPVVAIVGGGHYGRFVPYGDPARHVFLTRESGCFHCNWICTKENVECVAGVTPTEVAEAAARLLKERGLL